jgi:hypothetical protein
MEVAVGGGADTQELSISGMAKITDIRCIFM